MDSGTSDEEKEKAPPRDQRLEEALNHPLRAKIFAKLLKHQAGSSEGKPPGLK
jgi:hypothetical protein